MHGAQDSSSFILLHEHAKVFKIIYTNCQKRLSGKVIVRETSVALSRNDDERITIVYFIVRVLQPRLYDAAGCSTGLITGCIV